MKSSYHEVKSCTFNNGGEFHIPFEKEKDKTYFSRVGEQSRLGRRGEEKQEVGKFS